MKIKIKEDRNNIFVRVSGDIYSVNGIKLSKTLENLQASKYEKIIVDLSNVGYIDSCGIGGLIYSQKILQKHNKKIVLSAPLDYIRILFRDCAVEKAFEVISNV